MTTNEVSASDFMTALRSGTARDWRGSRIVGEVDLTAADIPHSVVVEGAEFAEAVSFAQARFGRGVDLSGCRFGTSLTFTDARVEGTLRLDDVMVGTKGAETPPSLTNLRHIVRVLKEGCARATGALLSVREQRLARWRGCLAEASRNPVPQAVVLNLDGAHIEGALSMTDAHVFGSISADFAQVARYFRLDRTIVHGDFLLREISVKWMSTSMTGGDISFRVDGTINLGGANVTGDLHLLGAVIDGELLLQSATIGGNLLCRVEQGRLSRLRSGAWCVLMQVKGTVDLDGTRIRGDLNLTGVTVGNTLSCRRTDVDGMLSVQNADITGDFRLSGGRVCGELIMEGAKFGQNVMLEVDGMRTRVRGGVHMISTHVNGWVVLGGAFLEKSIVLDNATIGGQLSLIYDGDPALGFLAVMTEVGGDVRAESATIGKHAHFLGARIVGSVRLAGAHVGGELALHSTTVGKDIVDSKRAGRETISPEQEAAFIASINSAGTTIGGNLDLQRTRIDGGVELAGTTIGGTLSLRDANVRAKIRCGGANGVPTSAQSIDFETLEMVGDVSLTSFAVAGDVSLRDCSVKGTVSLYEGDAAGKIGGRLRLEGAEISELMFTGRNFPEEQGSVVLERAKLGRLRIDGSMPAALDLRNMSVDRIDNLEDGTHLDLLAHTRPFEKSNYLSIEHALRNAGHDSWADEVHVRMRREDRKSTRGFARRVFDWFLDVTIGYGTNSQRLGLVMLLLFVVSLALFADRNRVELDIGPSVAAPESHVHPPRWDLLDAAMFTAQLHVPIISLGVKSEIRPSGPEWRAYAMIVAALHWLMWPLLIASVSGVVRKRT